MENIVNLVIEQLSYFYAIKRTHLSTYQRILFLHMNGIVQKISFHLLGEDESHKKWRIVVQTDCVSHFIPNQQNSEILNTLNKEASCFSFVFAGIQKGVVASTTFTCLSTILVKDLQILMHVSLLQFIACQEQRALLVQKCGCTLPVYDSWLDEYCRNVDVDFVSLKKVALSAQDKLPKNIFKNIKRKDYAPLHILTTSSDKDVFLQTIEGEKDIPIKLVMHTLRNKKDEGDAIDVSFAFLCQRNLLLSTQLNANAAFASLGRNVFGSFRAEEDTILYHAVYPSFFMSRVDIEDIYCDMLILITNLMKYLQIHSIHSNISESPEASFHA